MLGSATKRTIAELNKVFDVIKEVKVMPENQCRKVDQQSIFGFLYDPFPLISAVR